jgi:WD40 repeat protein
MPRHSPSNRIAALVAISSVAVGLGGCSWLDRLPRRAPQRPAPAPAPAPASASPADYGAVLEARHWSVPEGVRAAALDPSGTWIAYVPWDRSRTVIARLEDGGAAAEIAAEPPYRVPSSLVFSSGGERIAIGGMGVVDVVRSASGEVLQRIELDNPQGGRTTPVLAVEHDGKLLAASAGPALHLVDLESGELLRSRTLGEFGLQLVAFSPDGERLATYGSGQELEIWPVADLLADGKPEPRTLSTGRAISAIAFDPSGATLAAADRENRVHLYDSARGAERTGFEIGESWVRTLAFTPGGEQLIGGCGDGAVRVWNPSNGALIAAHPVAQITAAAAITRGGGDLLVQIHRGDLVALQPAAR